MHRSRRIAAQVAAQVIALAITMGPLLGLPWWRGMRGYFPTDPLSYAAIATNVASGAWAPVEPFTLTGTSTYPSAWYVLIGAVSGLTGLAVPLVWTILGIAVLGAAVFVTGSAAARLSGLWWAPLLPALALLTGTFSLRGTGNWYTPLGEHAVLWGPYGTAFVLNAEVAALSLAAIVITLLVLATAPAQQHAARRQQTAARNVIAAAALLGALANVQTYAFLAGTFLAVSFVAARELLVHRHRGRTAATVALPLLVLLLGNALAAAIGPLPLFGLLIASFAPALVSAARRQPRIALLAAAAYALLASPQVLRTVLGLLGDDPFLTYRQASTANLGIGTTGALAASAVWLLAFVVSALGLRHARQPATTALLVALGAGFLVLPTNDLWGFNQEPYRLWIAMAFLSALLLPIPLAWAIAHRPRRSVSFLVALAALAGTWALSLQDVAAFVSYARQQGVIDLTGDRAAAIRELADEYPGLLLSSQCLNPRHLKLITAGPVAEYNLGLAWPDDEPAFRIFHDPGRRAGEDPVALQAAKVRWVLTDSACPTDWAFPGDGRVVRAAQRDYRADDGSEQALRLWLVNPA